jgi:hypothetical protein
VQHVKERAREVNNVAEEFSLSHAVMALRRILEDEIKSRCSPALRELKQSIIDEPEKEISEFERLKKGIFNLEHNRVFIVVDYIDEMHLSGSRTITSDGDYIEIILPGSLRGDIDGLRNALGHELGHLALHIDELFANAKKYPYQGTAMIRDPEKEREAHDFAVELVLLRNEHLKATLCKDCKDR